jgi:hypothetical protein
VISLRVGPQRKYHLLLYAVFELASFGASVSAVLNVLLQIANKLGLSKKNYMFHAWQ